MSSQSKLGLECVVNVVDKIDLILKNTTFPLGLDLKLPTSIIVINQNLILFRFILKFT